MSQQHAFGPSIGKYIVLGHLPYEYREEYRELLAEYLDEQFTMRLLAVGFQSHFYPEN